MLEATVTVKLINVCSEKVTQVLHFLSVRFPWKKYQCLQFPYI